MRVANMVILIVLITAVTSLVLSEGVADESDKGSFAVKITNEPILGVPLQKARTAPLPHDASVLDTRRPAVETTSIGKAPTERDTIYWRSKEIKLESTEIVPARTEDIERDLLLEPKATFTKKIAPPQAKKRVLKGEKGRTTLTVEEPVEMRIEVIPEPRQNLKDEDNKLEVP